MDSRKHIPELDGLRGIAVLMVIAFHFGIYVKLPEICRAVVSFGWTGVDLFFVLSGFLIGGILIDQRETPHYFKAFYARRFFRIIPLYVLIIAAYGAAWLLSSGSRPSFTSYFLQPMPWYTYLTFTSNFWIAKYAKTEVFLGVAWSLAIEEQFYVTWPLVVRFVKPRLLPLLTGALVLSVLGARAYAGQSGLIPSWFAAYTLPWFRADGLLIGVLCAILVRHDAVRAFLHRQCWLLYVLASAFFAGLYAINMACGQAPDSMQVKYGYTVLALFWAALLLIAVVRPGPFRVLSLRPLREVGKVAYFLYLTHLIVMFAVLVLVVHLGGFARFSYSQVLWMFGASFLATFVLAQLSWFLFESRMTRIGHRFHFGNSPVFPGGDDRHLVPADEPMGATAPSS